MASTEEEDEVVMHFYNDSPTPMPKNDCFPLRLERTVGNAESADTVMAGTVAVFALLALGFLLGALLALIVFRFFCRRWWKSEYHAVSEAGRNESSCKRMLLCLFPFCRSHEPTFAFGERTELCDTEDEAGGAMMGDSDEEVTVDRGEVREEAPAEEQDTLGITDLVLQSTREGPLTENDDEVGNIDEMENTIKKQRTDMSKALARIHLNEQSMGADKQQTMQQIEHVFKQLTAALRARSVALEKQMVEQMSKLDKNSPDFEHEVQTIKTTFRNQMHTEFKDVLGELRESLQDNTELSDAKVEELLNDLSRSLTELERILSDNLDIKAEALLNRSARRRQFVDKMQHRKKQYERDVEDHKSIAERLLATDSLSEHVQRELIQSFHAALKRAEDTQLKDIQTESELQVEKARKNRQQRLNELRKRQRTEIEQLLQSWEGKTDAAGFLTAVDRLLNRHAEETTALWTDIDGDESAKISGILFKMENSWNDRMKEAVANLNQSLAGKMTDLELKNLQREFEMELSDVRRLRQVEAQAFENDLELSYQQEIEQNHSQISRQNSAVLAIAANQYDIIETVQDGIPNLSDRDKNEILCAHEYNRQALANQLKLSRLRQEQKLQQEFMQRKRRRSVDQEQAEREHKQKIKELKDRLTRETNDILKAQEDAMAAVFGRLQVSHARRQVALEGQQKLVQRLEQLATIEKELREQAKDSPVEDGKLEGLLTTHKQQVEELNKKLLDSRVKQMDNLKQKLELKRQDRQKTLNDRHEQEEGEVTKNTQERRLSLAESLLEQGEVTQDHEKRTATLEVRVRAELLRQKRRLNRQMKLELERCLLEQKQQFLTQLAEMISVNKAVRAKNQAVSVGVVALDGQEPIRRKSTKGSERSVSETTTKRSKGRKSRKIKPIDRQNLLEPTTPPSTGEPTK